MFTFERMSFRYRDHIFTDFSAEIPTRKIGVVGKNGVGKTTLLRLLDQQLVPQAGSVQVDGSTYLVDFELRKYASFQLTDLFALVSPLASFDLAAAPRLVDDLNLTDYQRTPLGELSKGVTKKVSLLLGLLSTTDVLLIDEPFESIDRDSNEALIGVLRASARGLVVVSHDEDHLERCVDEVYQVDGGRLVTRC
ncbi:MAG: ATP-binding cassette domain-containing protein [Propionibacteriaceae bacterium]|nr:ATP-binding cassette domain-containing protein [Propionibacteriaceae bacterium]